MTMRKKLLITIACLSCILCIMVTGTIAWLTAETGPITNTFTPSNISVSLVEENKGVDYKFQMIPGKTYTKDPKVTVTNDIDCYVFVKVDETNNTWDGKKVVTYTMGEGWIQLKDASDNVIPGVYYRTVAANAAVADKAFFVIADNEVTINGALTKAYMSGLTADSLYPKLSFTAYVCQLEGFNSAALAWAEINK